MKIFEYKDYTLTLNTAEILLIPEFKAVMDSDKTKDKKNAFKIFTYGYLLIDWNSPFREYSDEDKKIEAVKSSEINDKDLESPITLAFIEKYKEILNSNRIIRYIKSTWTMLDKLEDYAETVDLTQTIESGPQKGRLTFNVKDVRDTIKQMEELIFKARNLRNVLKEEMEEEGSKSRGSNSVGYFNE